MIEVFDGEVAKYPEELFRIVFEVAERVQILGGSSGKGGVDVSPEMLRGTHLITRIRVLEAKLHVRQGENGETGLSSGDDFVVGYVSIQPNSNGGCRVMIEQLAEPKPTKRLISEDATGKTFIREQPAQNECAAYVQIISGDGFDRAIWFENFTYLFLLQADSSPRADLWLRAIGNPSDFIQKVRFENGHLRLLDGYTMTRYLADRQKSIERQQTRLKERGEEAATLFVGRCKDAQRLVESIEAFIGKQLLPYNDGIKLPLHGGSIKLSYNGVSKQYEIQATVRGLGEYPIGRLEISPANDTEDEFELVRYANSFVDWSGFDYQWVRDLFDALAEKLRKDYGEQVGQSPHPPGITHTLGVLVSGTMEDMKPERNSVARAIASLLLNAYCAETEFSEDRPSRDKILAMVRECDIYLGVYNQTRYGWTIPEDGISVTELEFNEAQRLHKPTLILVKALPKDWSPKDAAETDQREKQKAFWNRVLDFEQGKFRAPEFESLIQLEQRVAGSLMTLLIERFKWTATLPHLESSEVMSATSKD